MAGKKTGTAVTFEIMDYIFDELAGGRSLVDICKEENMPSKEAVRRFVAKDQDTKENYYLARQMQADFYAEKIESLAASFKDCTYIDEHGNERIDNAAINAVRAEIDTYKWLASKLSKSVFGESSNINLSGQLDTGRDGVVTDAMLEAIIKKGHSEAELEEESVKSESSRSGNASVPKKKGKK